MTVVTRFAPAPTGRLHVGNIRTALHNWLFANKHGGRFLLRLDDTDEERSEERFAQAIRDDLAWLGLDPDGEERQSRRMARYERAFDHLLDIGRVYPAYESPRELELKRKMLMSRGRPPIYDRAALKLSELELAKYREEGREPHYRFLLDHAAPIAWDDLVRGPQLIEPAMLSDPVIRRADGSWLYMLPSTVDDIEMGISHVVRGEDHVSNTALQIQMFAALGAEPPSFAHEALLVGAEGKLSKRLGSLGVEAMKERGIEPVALLALLARIGTSRPVEPVTDIAALVETFDFSDFGRAPARFDMTELERLNARIVHQLGFSAVEGELPEGMSAEAWAVIRPNVGNVSEAAKWVPVLRGEIEPMADEADRDFLAEAAGIAEGLEWEDGVWPELTARLKARTGRKGKALFQPLRRALTGRDSGPEMAALLPLIGKQRSLARLRAAARSG